MTKNKSSLDERSAFELAAREWPFIKDLQRFPANHPDKERAGRYGHYESEKAYIIWTEALQYSMNKNSIQQELDAAFERGREQGKFERGDPFGHSHLCRHCKHPYTPTGNDEDCPKCGSDGINQPNNVKRRP